MHGLLQLLFAVNMKQNHIHNDFPLTIAYIPGHKTTKEKTSIYLQLSSVLLMQLCV